MVLFYKPIAGLQHFVSKIMLAHEVLDPDLPRSANPLPPQPEHCLYFYPYDKIIRKNPGTALAEYLPRSIIVGPKVQKVELTMAYNNLVIIVIFFPGGLHRFLRVPMNEIVNQTIDTSLLFGTEIELINQQINEASCYDQMVRVVEQFLLNKAGRLKTILPLDQVLSHLLVHRNTIKIDQLAKQACVSTRQLERQFRERIGLPPKTFTRLARFSKAWLMKETNPGISWSKIAHACDYADQMHMINDFKDFAGVTPGILQTEIEKSQIRLHTNSY